MALRRVSRGGDTQRPFEVRLEDRQRSGGKAWKSGTPAAFRGLVEAAAAHVHGGCAAERTQRPGLSMPSVGPLGT